MKESVAFELRAMRPGDWQPAVSETSGAGSQVTRIHYEVVATHAGADEAMNVLFRVTRQELRMVSLDKVGE